MPSDELSFETICAIAGVPEEADVTAFDWTCDGIRIEYDLPDADPDRGHV